ncbi:diacylglycerol/lipid kinase family protein [Hufsiella ginkgonis]|uniref:YegS/Rv2252/BmrU family lipid kinase n=1 Tax=Hufsiella ginkgonis TaxID=2695274 RepID=A0A7K1Y4A3_9SPHI|nr:diacylglycerol kinase family protein [Hufsiella ginkgonis]MXV17536.1 YegS/Rv2252/BmrU family lipid kinase [Hufsiella ginkgonis]
MRKRILFIINPISGGKDKTRVPRLIEKYLDKEKFRPEYLFTEGRGHARELTATEVANQAAIIVAVGGDGTINEVAGAIEGSATTMGIIPCGSGNGLARSLGIPLNLRKAIGELNLLQEKVIDTGDMNGKKFFNMAGMGFDAHISAKFAHDHTRGFMGYVRTSFAEITTYRAQDYRVVVDGVVADREAFMISIANSSQFGNGAHVSPYASLTDGLLDVCIIKPFPLYHFPVMGYHMFSKTADKSGYVEIIRGSSIQISRAKEGPVHLDGEPVVMEKELKIEMKPLSLKILV